MEARLNKKGLYKRYLAGEKIESLSNRQQSVLRIALEELYGGKENMALVTDNVSSEN